MASDPSKTEKPTPKKIKKAREKGSVAKSQEIGIAVTILGGLIGLTFWIDEIGLTLMRIFRYFFTEAIMRVETTDTGILVMFSWLVKELAYMLLPVMFILFLITLIAQRAQVGKLWTTKVFKPELKKFNPIPGLKRMFFSMQTFVRLLKSILKAVVIALAVWLVIRGEIDGLTKLYYTDAFGFSAYLLNLSFKMTVYALVPIIIIAAADLIYSRWEYIEKLKMTKDEVKDERKQAEGDPKIKSQQRQKMMEMSRRRMMHQVPKADIIITNPTHIAVALRYNLMEAPAPVVLAMGADKIAEKIREIARENHIPIKENKTLARALYKYAEVGEMIPEDLYQAVATILAQLWKSQGTVPPTAQSK